jgi:hypothetical protein
MRAETFSTPALFVAEIVTQTDGDDFAVVISDVDCIDEETLAAVVPVLQPRATRGWIAATMSSSMPSPVIELLLPLFTHTVTVPALRYRIEDIEVLVPFLLRELTSGADVRLAADAMRRATASVMILTIGLFKPRLGRRAGIVGPEVTVGSDASLQDRLLGAMGRTPRPRAGRNRLPANTSSYCATRAWSKFAPMPPAGSTVPIWPASPRWQPCSMTSGPGRYND